MLALCSCGDNGTAKGENDKTSTSSKAASKNDGDENFERIKIEHESDPILRMLVISDVHNKTDRLSKAIASTWSYAQTQQYKGFDAILIVGDLTDNGTDEELSAIMSAYKNAVAATGQSIPLISSVGTTAVEVTFPQATDDDKIEKYRVDVLDASGKSVANISDKGYFISSQGTGHYLKLKEAANLNDTSVVDKAGATFENFELKK